MTHTENNDKEIDKKIGNIVYSLNCCSSGCDGWVHQDDQKQAKKNIKSLLNDRIIEELQTLVLYAPQFEEGYCIIHDKAMERIEELRG